MFARRVAESWERFGRWDPYFGVLNTPRFRDAAHPGAARDEFFRTGEDHVEHLFSTIRESLLPEFSPQRALDFGCGVGRVTLPLAPRVGAVTGVDISPSMLSEASRNCVRAGIANCAFRAPDFLRNCPQKFDFIHSYIVFQHVPPREGMRELRALVSLLSEDGIGAIHFVYRASIPRWRRALHVARKNVPLVHPTLNLLQGRSLRSPLMQMHCYDLNAVFGLLQQCDCHRIGVRFSDHDGWLGAMVFFQRRHDLDVRIS